MKHLMRIWALPLLLLLTTCSTADEITSIFWGRRWRVTRIMESNKKSLLTSEEQQALEESSTTSFTLYFDQNSCTARLENNSYAGTWQVDGKKHTIAFDIDWNGANPTTTAEELMKSIIEEAYKYSADTQYLRIYSPAGFLLFYPLN